MLASDRLRREKVISSIIGKRTLRAFARSRPDKMKETKPKRNKNQ